MKYGCFGINIRRPLSEEEQNILLRFTIEFERAYTRFLDLKKAEEQAREAQIEASLEKVRGVALSLQKSDEMLQVAQVLYEQLLELGFSNIRNAIIDIKNGDTDTFTDYDYSHEMSGTITQMSYDDDPTLKGQFRKMAKTTNDFFELVLDGKELEDLKKMRLKNGEAPDARLDNIDLLTYNLYSFGNGAIGISNFGVLIAEEKSVLNRFSNVFTFAYKRYTDMVQAENQAREVQIELSLERIRAQVTAMQESSDLFDIVVNMRTEFLSLGHKADYFWHMRWLQDSYEMSMTSEDGNRLGMVISIPSYVHEKIPGLAKWEKGDEPVYVLALDADGAWDYIENMNTHGHYKQVDPNAPTQDDIRHIGGLTFIIARTTHGEIGYSLPGVVPNPPKEDLNILVRFAGVFDLAYRRFEDLKSAEYQHKEAQMELALERVRARALAMQQPEELKDVADVLRNEMGKLGIEELETCSIYINDESAEKAECWYAIKDVRESETTLVNDYFALNLNDTWVGKKMLKFYQSKNQQVSIVMKGKPRIEWIRYCEERSVPLRGYYGEVIPDRIYHLYKFSHGAIGVATPDTISDENWGLLKRTASVFSLAYSRFKDLTQARIDLLRLKEEKKRAEDALTDLKATQEQLVHAEKMASLGELTAGIAHEIQNPLNFVNNFSEVNAELIEELRDELKNGELEEVIAIIDDIAGNEEKIKHHGKRAETIVKGMLQHSRTTTAEKELTDINELADEFLRLAYHGLRAKDKSFNADFKLELDETLPKIKVIAAGYWPGIIEFN